MLESVRLTADETITQPLADGRCGDAPAEAGRDAALLGKTIGSRYVVEAVLGQGGMGTVYAAFDAVAEHRVALKFIRPELASNARAGQRLRSELRAALAVTHPNVARTHTLEELDGHTFLVMERLDGPTLDERLALGPVPFADALALARGIVAGVDAAHARGVVHRDLKPLNIKLVAGGRPVIMDFGLAVLHLEQAESRERTGNTIVGGTPGYMAPEVVAGEIGGRRADVYALGVLLHELFTGRRPAPAASTSLPAWLDRLLSDMVAADPEARPLHAGEVRWRLDRGDGATQTRRRRSIGLAAGAALVAAAASAGIVLALVHPGRDRAAPAAAIPAPVAAIPAPAAAIPAPATGATLPPATAVPPPADPAPPPAGATPPLAHGARPSAATVLPTGATPPLAHPARPPSATGSAGRAATAPARKQPARTAPTVSRDAGAPPADAALPPPPPRPIDPDAPWDPASTPRDADVR